MRLTYIFHSGFAVETRSCILVFDYWMDPSSVMPALLASGKPLYVFASHFHEDHFIREIFSWRKGGADVRYILSKDILRRHRASIGDADELNILDLVEYVFSESADNRIESRTISPASKNSYFHLSLLR